MGRTVDHDEIGCARMISDPLPRAPAGECCKLKADSPDAEPRPSQFGPCRETPLRVDVEQSDRQTLPQPRDSELCGERCFAGAALALRDRNYQPRHRPALAEVEARA